MKKYYTKSRKTGISYEVHTINRMNATWVGHNMCRNCLLKHVTGGKIRGRTEVTEGEEEDVS
jgi:molybdenum-dependent DNA-binding transcriptional regulator ModE